MIYTEKTRTAMCIAYEAHKEQKDKSGVPYIFHPMHLAEQMEEESLTAAALLHDVLEDSAVTEDDLRQAGIAECVIEAVHLLTRDKTMSYEEYVEKLAGNRIARCVKLADLRHNSDRSRLAVWDERAQARAARYAKAIAYLEVVESQKRNEMQSSATTQEITL